MWRKVFGASLLVVAAAAVAVPPAAGGGGGGCYEPMSDESTTRVGIKYSCYTPTVVRVSPGDTVTWINRDEVEHTVTGANGIWGRAGYRTLRDGDSIAFRFDREGTYPYFCQYHIGMVGTVVVGDGGATGTLDVRSARGAIEHVDLAPQAVSDVLPVPDPQEPNLWPVALILALGFVLGGLVGGFARLRRR